MKTNSIILRWATSEDAEAVLEIYAPYIENTSISFEYEVPSMEAFRRRMENIMSRFPYLVAVDTADSNKIIGYAYANTFRERAAYNWSSELSIYLSSESKGKGIGRRLYTALEYILRLQNILSIEASITESTEENDSYITPDSINFHKAMGFSRCGTVNNCGFKFGKWYNVIYMEKFIGSHTNDPAAVKLVGQVRHLVNLQQF